MIKYKKGQLGYARTANTDKLNGALLRLRHDWDGEGVNLFAETVEDGEGFEKGLVVLLGNDAFYPLPSRFFDACTIINPGACNPAGVSRALVEAIDECRVEGGDPRLCPACRLIAHQLAHILGALRYEAPDAESTSLYHSDAKTCREKRSKVEQVKWEHYGE